MPKESHDQSPEAASAVVARPPARNRKLRKTEATATNKKGMGSQTKSDRILSLLKQASGATLAELMKATKWQAHSVHGFLSGAVRKRKGLRVLSECDGAGRRRYRIDVGRDA